MDTRPDTSKDTSTVDTYTVGQAAERLGVSTKTLRRQIKAGKLPAVKQPGAKGPEWRIDKEEVDRRAEERGRLNANSDIVRATVDTQIESMSIKLSSLMEEWVDRWADSMQQIVQGVQAGQQQQTEALHDVAAAIRETGQQVERVTTLEKRIEELEQQPQPWYQRAWRWLKGA